MNLHQTPSRQRGTSAWALVGSLLIVAGMAGLGVALIKPGSQTPSIATVAPAAPVATGSAAAAAPTPADTKPAATSAASTSATNANAPSSGPHPNWHGTWQSTKPDSKLVISAAGVEIFHARENNGKVEKFQQMARWSNANEPNGNDEASGYAKSSVSLTEISRAYEASVTLFQRDPSDFGISDPTLSRRFIGRIKPGNYRVVWADLGGDCGGQDMIIDDDLILSVATCKYQHTIELFTRVR